LPFPSVAIPSGRLRAALTASPPSPEKPAVPVPAKVVIFPDVSTFLILELFLSAI
jgi:hypothetical protein